MNKPITLTPEAVEAVNQLCDCGQLSADVNSLGSLLDTLLTCDTAKADGDILEDLRFVNDLRNRLRRLACAVGSPSGD